MRMPVLLDLGRVIGEARTRARWTQRELARRSGVSQPEISRIERGLSPNVRLTTVDRLLTLLGVRYRIDFDLPGSPAPQRDFVHAWGLGTVRRRLGRMGFEVEGEVEIGGDRSRGWIDVLSFREVDGLLVIGEFKSDLIDMGGLERQVGWYEREAVAAASRRHWRPRRVVAIAFVLATGANDARIRANLPLLRAAFPGRAHDLQTVFGGEAPRHRRYLVMIDPGSRATKCILPTVAERRRRSAPYADYADAARHASRR